MFGQPTARTLLMRANGSVVVSDGDSWRLLTFEPDGKVVVLTGPAERSF